MAEGFKPGEANVLEADLSGLKKLGKGIGGYFKDKATDAMNLDFVSNGFKLRASDGALNGSGSTYIYMTFAENPFVANDSGTVVPGTAR